MKNNRIYLVLCKICVFKPLYFMKRTLFGVVANVKDWGIVVSEFEL